MKANYSLLGMSLVGLLGFSITASCSSDDTKPVEAQQNQAQTQTTPTNPAQSTSVSTPVSSTDATTPLEEGRVSATQVRKKLLCPEYIDLKKEGMFWGAPGGWRSFSQSFVDDIISFVEAQWHGVNVGKMMCVYVGKEKRSFPVVLQNDRLVKMPAEYKWGGLKEGVVSCKSTNINDCPFFYIERDIDFKKAYDELDFKKGKSMDLD